MNKIIAYSVLVAVVFFGILFGVTSYFRDETLKTAPVQADGQPEQVLAEASTFQTTINQETHPISLALLSIVLALQFFALTSSIRVLNTIKLRDEPNELKLNRLKNADIFFDLPIYIGLFGTVVSFIIIAFSPKMGRLIAYSSTLVGILLSVTLRTAALYPYRESLIQKDAS